MIEQKFNELRDKETSYDVLENEKDFDEIKNYMTIGSQEIKMRSCIDVLCVCLTPPLTRKYDRSVQLPLCTSTIRRRL